MKLKPMIHLCVLFWVISFMGVGMILLSNLTTPLLPDTYDPSRPEDTWGCCTTIVTAHPWRWPLFLAGSGLLMLSATWGIFYLHRGMRRIVEQPSNKNTPDKSCHTILERVIMMTPIGIAVTILGSIGVRFAVATTPLSTLEFWPIVLHVLITVAWITTLAYGCLLVSLYSIATLARWRAKQLNSTYWRKKQLPIATLQMLALIVFVPLVWLIVHYFVPADHAATSSGRYPLDIVVRLLGSRWNEFYLMMITCGIFIAITTTTAYIHFFASSYPHPTKRRKTTMPAPTDTPS